MLFHQQPHIYFTKLRSYLCQTNQKLKIADLKSELLRIHAFPMGVKAYVKIETNMGVTGWGRN